MSRVILMIGSAIFASISLATGLYGPEILRVISLMTGIVSILGGCWANISSDTRAASRGSTDALIELDDVDVGSSLERGFGVLSAVFEPNPSVVNNGITAVQRDDGAPETLSIEDNNDTATSDIGGNSAPKFLPEMSDHTTQQEFGGYGLATGVEAATERHSVARRTLPVGRTNIMRLNNTIQAAPGISITWGDSVHKNAEGGQIWSVDLFILLPNGNQVSFTGQGRKISHAREQACEQAIQVLFPGL
ncbi:hypothetical protein DL93DRAFT_2096880 [Clavulina sp. PMI_390]|nr:hypothetical protein DL93DRAFT_2096880 [Clavulina sp. PMI_390]